MGNVLPAIPERQFRDHLSRRSPTPLSERALDALWAHFVELRRWNPKLSLIGPGTTAEILDRHYGESLAALELLDASDRVLLDVGSGGGFPGLVLAAARPDLAVTLVEPRQRKWAFLMTAVRRGGLSCKVLDARVERPLNPSWALPEAIDVVTLRALTATQDLLGVLRATSPNARFLLWRGREALDSRSGLTVGREIPLPGEHRKILELVP